MYWLQAQLPAFSPTPWHYYSSLTITFRILDIAALSMKRKGAIYSPLAVHGSILPASDDLGL